MRMSKIAVYPFVTDSTGDSTEASTKAPMEVMEAFVEVVEAFVEVMKASMEVTFMETLPWKLKVRVRVRLFPWKLP